MSLKKLLREKNISVYQLAKVSGVPYATTNELCNCKADIKRCNAETVYRIAKALDVSMESLLEPELAYRPDFENYKSNICHQVKELGDIAFIFKILEDRKIDKYYDLEWYPECLYLLAMVDYLSRMNRVPLCEDYASIRCAKLDKVILPASVMAMNSEAITEQAIRNSIPEFISHNIVESEIRDVV